MSEGFAHLEDTKRVKSERVTLTEWKRKARNSVKRLEKAIDDSFTSAEFSEFSTEAQRDRKLWCTVVKKTAVACFQDDLNYLAPGQLDLEPFFAVELSSHEWLAQRDAYYQMRKEKFTYGWNFLGKERLSDHYYWKGHQHTMYYKQLEADKNRDTPAHSHNAADAPNCRRIREYQLQEHSAWQSSFDTILVPQIEERLDALRLKSEWQDLYGSNLGELLESTLQETKRRVRQGLEECCTKELANYHSESFRSPPDNAQLKVEMKLISHREPHISWEVEPRRGGVNGRRWQANDWHGRAERKGIVPLDIHDHKEDESEVAESSVGSTLANAARYLLSRILSYPKSAFDNLAESSVRPASVTPASDATGFDTPTPSNQPGGSMSGATTLVGSTTPVDGNLTPMSTLYPNTPSIPQERDAVLDHYRRNY